MAHIRYGDRNYSIPVSQIEETKNIILTTLTNDAVVAIGVGDEAVGGYPSTIYISRGVPVSVNDWDPNEH